MKKSIRVFLLVAAALLLFAGGGAVGYFSAAQCPEQTVKVVPLPGDGDYEESLDLSYDKKTQVCTARWRMGSFEHYDDLVSSAMEGALMRLRSVIRLDYANQMGELEQDDTGRYYGESARGRYNAANETVELSFRMPAKDADRLFRLHDTLFLTSEAVMAAGNVMSKKYKDKFKRGR